ncbi:hypothetical protein PYW07_008348 [Mythimna separata]|uniref:Metalloendopeptidase n=1 Tax=Mythimna separata TaxID=271217 RepID=A0AAD8DN25_MYTSE|nr:hypothetical protein PYW07_008348 [Mythimna separata]
MIGFLQIYIFFNLYFILIKCNLRDDLSVRFTDQRLIQKQRQDTREMCKIFNSEAPKSGSPTGALPLIKYNKRKKELKPKGKKKVIPSKKTKRMKRAINSINPAMNVHDEERVETIVDKIYDDLMDKGQEVYYRRRFFAQPSPKKKDTAPAAQKSGRRFPFAPSILDEGLISDKHDHLPEDIVSQTKRVRFPKAIVPYFIDPKTYDTHLQEIITKAFDYFEKATCIRLQRLRERPRDQRSLQNVIWLYISNPSGIRQCVHSNERAEIHGVQLVTFGYDCMSIGDISHEIMHMLGFSHEHLRPDRDQHITILWENIKPGYRQYFEVRNETIVENLPYDYASVLHYPAKAFSRNGKATILTENGIKIGQREALSEMDVERISILYSNECIKRNQEYLLKTCPSVVKPTATRTITEEEIDLYFDNRVWPYGLIIYEFNNRNEFSSEEKENIKAVMQHIRNETCVVFQELSTSESHEDKPSGDDGAGGEDQPDDFVAGGDDQPDDNGVDGGDKTDDCDGADDDDGANGNDQTDNEDGADGGDERVDDGGADGGDERVDDGGADGDVKTDDDDRKDEDGNGNNSSDIRFSSSYNFDTDELENLVVLSNSAENLNITDTSISSEEVMILRGRILSAGRKDVIAKNNTNVKSKGVVRNDTNIGRKKNNTNIGRKKNNTNIRRKINNTNISRKTNNTNISRKTNNTNIGRKTNNTNIGSKKNNTNIGRKKNITNIRRKTNNTNIGRKKNHTYIGTRRINTHIGGKVKTTNVAKKPTVLRKSRKVRPTRRHAGPILKLYRSSEPGCACPQPGKPQGTSLDLKLNADCFNSVNDLLHVFVHVLGLDHQHNMHDRDSYLHIAWDQLNEGIKNEMKEKLPPAASVGFPYDYQSVMHYPWLQIKDGATNIMYPIWNDGWAMGHWQGLSTIDIQKIKHIYAEVCEDRAQFNIEYNLGNQGTGGNHTDDDTDEYGGHRTDDDKDKNDGPDTDKDKNDGPDTDKGKDNNGGPKTDEDKYGAPETGEDKDNDDDEGVNSDTLEIEYQTGEYRKSKP